MNKILKVEGLVKKQSFALKNVSFPYPKVTSWFCRPKRRGKQPPLRLF